jgi:hypothetical protein
MYACVRRTGRGFFEGVCPPSNATADFRDPPYPATRKNRSPIARTPARRESLAALPTSTSASAWIGGWRSSICVYQRTTYKASVSASVPSINAEFNLLPPVTWRCSHCGSGKLFAPHFVLFDPKVAKMLYCYTYLRYELRKPVLVSSPFLFPPITLIRAPALST